MPVHDDLGLRMKTFYEEIPKTKLMRRCPVAIRIDGKAFHTFTRKFQKPFDEILIESMQETMKYLCENIQGCVLGYTQSDEITLILVDYKKLTSVAWFDYEVQKVCSIAASMATMAFNRNFRDTIDLAYDQEFRDLGLNKEPDKSQEDDYNKKFEVLEKKYDKYYSQIDKAMFDARCFSIPKEEVANLIYWRQLDATRNSIQMVGQANFSHKELQNKSCNQIQDMLMVQKSINWNNFPTYQKRGSCCIKEEKMIEDQMRSSWIIDTEIPIFKGIDRDYVEKRILIGE